MGGWFPVRLVVRAAPPPIAELRRGAQRCIASRAACGGAKAHAPLAAHSFAPAPLQMRNRARRLLAVLPPCLIQMAHAAPDRRRRKSESASRLHANAQVEKLKMPMSEVYREIVAGSIAEVRDLR